MRSFDTDDYLAMLKSNYIGWASDLQKLEMNGRYASVGNQASYNSRRQSGSLNRLHFFQSALRKSGKQLRIDRSRTLPIQQRNFGHQAADAGGRLRNRRDSCSAFSSSLGYLIRVCSMFCNVNRKVSEIARISFKVKSHSSKLPSAIRLFTISVTTFSTFYDVVLSRLRDALSTASAKLIIPLSLNCGLGPL